MRIGRVVFGIVFILIAFPILAGIYQVVRSTFQTKPLVADQELKQVASELACKLDSSIDCQMIDGKLTIRPLKEKSVNTETEAGGTPSQ